MVSDFIKRVQNITLIKEEREVIKVGGAHKGKIFEECSLSLLGFFLTTRSYNQNAAKSLIRFVWKMVLIQGLWMCEMDYFNSSLL